MTTLVANSPHSKGLGPGEEGCINPRRVRGLPSVLTNKNSCPVATASRWPAGDGHVTHVYESCSKYG